ncbi:unnamed protein product, partial [Polarella glacialis]
HSSLPSSAFAEIMASVERWSSASTERSGGSSQSRLPARARAQRTGGHGSGLLLAVWLAAAVACGVGSSLVSSFVSAAPPRRASSWKSGLSAAAKEGKTESLDGDTELDAWDVLGLPWNSEKDAIKKRFRKLVSTQHPDRRPDDPTAPAKFMRIRRAYEKLMGADSTVSELQQWAESNREWSKAARDFLGEDDSPPPPPEVPLPLYLGVAVLFTVMGVGTYWALNK